MTAIGVAGLLVGAGVGIAAKGNNTKTVTARYTTTSASVAQAPVHTETHGGTRTVTRTVTHTVTHTVGAPPPEPSRTVAAAPTTFSGSGRKHIGTIVAPTVSAVNWHASGGYLYIANPPESADHLEFSEKGTSGKTAIAKGTYPNLEVVARGEWGFTLTPEP